MPGIVLDPGDRPHVDPGEFGYLREFATGPFGFCPLQGVPDKFHGFICSFGHNQIGNTYFFE